MSCRSALGAGRGSCEFTCCECGRDIISIGQDRPPEPPLCAACMTIPGWLQIPAFREILDPEGTIREPDYAALPTWGEP